MGAAKDQLGVEPVIDADHIVSEDVDHLGVMAYAAWFQASTRNERPPEPSDPPPTPPPLRVPPHVIEEPAPVIPQSSARPEVDVIVVESWRIDASNTIKVGLNDI